MIDSYNIAPRALNFGMELHVPVLKGAIETQVSDLGPSGPSCYYKY